MAMGIVMQCATILQRHADQRALGSFSRLADRFGDFTRFAMAETDPAALITNDHKRCKPKPTAALHHFGDAVDVDKLIDEFAVFAIAALSSFTGHVQFLP
jgi:hypothetical protein